MKGIGDGERTKVASCWNAILLFNEIDESISVAFCREAT